MVKIKTHKKKKIKKPKTKIININKHLINASVAMGIVCIGLEVYDIIIRNKIIKKLTNKQLECLKYIIKNKTLLKDSNLYHPNTTRSLVKKGLIKTRPYQSKKYYKLTELGLILEKRINEKIK